MKGRRRKKAEFSLFKKGLDKLFKEEELLTELDMFIYRYYVMKTKPNQCFSIDFYSL